jgi:hypothetical protein
MQPALRTPSLKGKDVAVFVAAVEEVFPKNLSEYESRWWKVYHQKLSEHQPPSVERMRDFVLQMWPRLFSPVESGKIRAAESIDELESAVGSFWLTPRRIRLMIEEPFAGPQRGTLVLYTGLGGGDCGVDFKTGQRWLVEAYLDTAGRWIAHQCSVTLPADHASAVLTKLRAERQ